MLTSFNNYVHLKTLHDITIKRKKLYYTIFPLERVIKDGTSKEETPKTAVKKYICRIVMIIP